MIKLVFKMKKKVPNFIEHVQELLDKLEEGSQNGNEIKFMKVDHTIQEEYHFKDMKGFKYLYLQMQQQKISPNFIFMKVLLITW